MRNINPLVQVNLLLQQQKFHLYSNNKEAYNYFASNVVLAKARTKWKRDLYV